MAKTLMNKVVALFTADKQVKTASFLVASLRTHSPSTVGRGVITWRGAILLMLRLTGRPFPCKNKRELQRLSASLRYACCKDELQMSCKY